MKWRTPHSNRPFIARNTTSRNDGTMTGQEVDEETGNGEGVEEKEEDESNDPKGDDLKRNK